MESIEISVYMIVIGCMGFIICIAASVDLLLGFVVASTIIGAFIFLLYNEKKNVRKKSDLIQVQ